MTTASAIPVPDLPLRGEHATFADAFEAAAAQFAGREAYVEGNRRLSYAVWHRLADGLAGALAARGIGPGDVVLVALESSIDFAVCCAGIMLAGAVASGVNSRLGPAEKEQIAKRSGACAIIVEDGAAAPAGVGLAIRRSELAALCTAPGLGAGRPGGRPEDAAMIVWTSGTTGAPKGAWFDHRGLAGAVATAGVAAAPFDRKLGSTPFAHSGYMTKLWEQIAFGMAIIISPLPWTARDMMRLIAEERISIAGAVPTQWAKLMAEAEGQEADFSSLRVALAATAPMPSDLAEAVMRRLGCPLIVRYAMTESPSITGTAPGDAPEILFGTVGRPQPGVTLRLVDADGNAVPTGEIGVVHLRSPVAMRGYWRDEAASRAAFTEDGWLVSGDLGRFDGEGNLVLTGRTGDMFIRGGYNVYPVEVEAACAENPAIAQIAVVGAPAPVIGEIGVAFVVPRDPAQPPTLDGLRAWCCARLADYKAPDALRIVEQLPLTPMMKVDRRALRDAAADAAREAWESRRMKAAQAPVS